MDSAYDDGAASRAVGSGDPFRVPVRRAKVGHGIRSVRRDAAPVRVRLVVAVRSREELAATIAAAPANHGSADRRSEVFFLKHPLTADVVYAGLPELRDGVDSVATGPGVLYFSRVAAQASRTRITRLMSMPVFQQMTVRTWRTTTRLSEMLGAA